MSGTRPSPAGRRVSAHALWAAAAFVAGRLIVLMTGAVAYSMRDSVATAGRWAYMPASLLQGGWLGKFIDPWVVWDGIWFAGIAKDGYERESSVAFFPLYPFAVRVADLVLRDVAVAGVLVSLVCAALAMVVLYRMVAARFGTAAAAWTVAFLSLCPYSFFFGAVYSEALFLLLVVGAFALAESGRWVQACAVGGLAALTRNTGVLLVLPLLLVYAEKRDVSLRHGKFTWPRDARMGWVALIPGGLLLYMAYLWWLAGDPLVFARTQIAWARSVVVPVVTVWRAASVAWSNGVEAVGGPVAVSWFAPGGRGEWLAVMYVLPFVALLIAVLLLVLAWRRLPAAYNVWALLVVVVPLCVPMGGNPLFSLPRFLLVGFPLFIGLALLTARWPLVRWSLLAVSVLLLVWLSASFALFTFVA